MAKWNRLMGDDLGPDRLRPWRLFSAQTLPLLRGCQEDDGDLRLQRDAPAYARDFYDDSLMRELDESGFLDRLYK